MLSPKHYKKSSKKGKEVARVDGGGQRMDNAQSMKVKSSKRCRCCWKR